MLSALCPQHGEACPMVSALVSAVVRLVTWAGLPPQHATPAAPPSPPPSVDGDVTAAPALLPGESGESL
jgi:hypothetical protein